MFSTNDSVDWFLIRLSIIMTEGMETRQGKYINITQIAGSHRRPVPVYLRKDAGCCG